MDILFLGNYKPDYMQDVIFHGLHELNCNITTNVNFDYMYNDYKNINKIYGKGFTLFGKLPSTNKSTVLSESNLKDMAFDCVIYGSIQRYNRDINHYINKFPTFFIDGEDNTNIISNILNKGLYFKRELTSLNDRILPITFGIPKSQISKKIPKKEKYKSDIIPGQKYSFNKEKDYYDEYRKSYFAITKKKTGWDCMRHYEILANRCLPYFLDIENCPTNTMFNWNKSALKSAKKEIDLNRDMDTIYKKYESVFYFDLLHKFTTDNIVKYILNHL